MKVMTVSKAGALFLTSLALVGCAGSLPGKSKQGHAGITDWAVEFNDETGKIESVRIIDGKEKADVSFKVDMEARVAEYEAKDVDAFEGQDKRAQVEKVLAEKYGEAAPGILDAILSIFGTP